VSNLQHAHPPAELDVAITVAALGIVAASLLLGRSREAEAVARPSGHSLTPHERTRRHR